MSKLLGIKNGKQYKVAYDEPDYDGIFDPCDFSEPWTLISFNSNIPFNKWVNGINGFQDWLNSKGIYIGYSLENMKNNCISHHVPEDGFFDKLHHVLARHDVLIHPINAYIHDAIDLSVGVTNNFDSGVVGIAVTTKKDLRKMYSCKYITKKIKKQAFKLLTITLQEYTNWANGDMYVLEECNKKGELIDCVGGIYQDDFDRLDKKEQFKEAVDNF